MGDASSAPANTSINTRPANRITRRNLVITHSLLPGLWVAARDARIASHSRKRPCLPLAPAISLIIAGPAGLPTRSTKQCAIQEVDGLGAYGRPQGRWGANMPGSCREGFNPGRPGWRARPLGPPGNGLFGRRTLDRHDGIDHDLGPRRRAGCHQRQAHEGQLEESDQAGNHDAHAGQSTTASGNVKASWRKPRVCSIVVGASRPSGGAGTEARAASGICGSARHLPGQASIRLASPR
jgi:hypothetical protein